ncbi:uncharacterized protein LOC118747386 [Rhagoletis pomonella]|uniref:uncharacterized protein LOC118747386 n=1 Tax=Rhagoletis pomonella TaxID=28610 RepID=UPI00177F1D4C|nr:uncharacterized protein LOC118747386 [Rhagoletis pomonella]
MNKSGGCAMGAWDILLFVSFFLVGLTIAQARVLPFVYSRTIFQNFEANKHVNESGGFNRFEGGRGGPGSFGYFEFTPNGTVILRGSAGNNANMPNILFLKAAVGGTKTYPRRVASYSKGNIKIYGDGIEHKFPPFLEHIIQRIQTYFSVYKYTDTSAAESSTVPAENISSEFNSTSSVGVQSTTQEDKGEYNEFIEIGEHDIDVIVVGVD